MSEPRIVSEGDLAMIRIPFRGKPKPRPRADRNIHNPTEYTDWKADVAAWLQSEGYHKLEIDRPVKLIAIFGTDYIDLQLIELGDVSRPKHVRADIDNLIGGLMDALQTAGVLANDRWMLGIEAKGWQ